MISTFRQILEIALFPPDRPGGLVLMPDSGLRGEPSDGGDRTRLHVARDLFPETCQVQYLSEGTAFIQELTDIVSAINPQRLFVLPPLVAYRSLPKEIQDQYPGLNFEEVILQVLTGILTPGAFVGLLLPSVFFSGERSRNIRERLARESTLRLVVTHDHSWPELGIHPELRLNTLLIEVGKPTRPQGEPFLRFFKCPAPINPQQQSEIISDLQRLLMQWGGWTKYGYVLRDELLPGAPLRHELYLPELVSRETELAQFGEVRPLGELVEPHSGLRSGIGGVERLKYEDGQGVPLLEARQIGSDGHIAFDELRYRVFTPERYLLETGDLCLRRIWVNIRRLHIAYIDTATLPLVADQSVLVLRPKPSTSPEQVELMLAYLRSTRGAESVAARSSGIVRSTARSLTAAALLDLPVPVPDPPLTIAIRSLNEAAAQFDTWKRETEEARNRLFHVGPAVARQQLLSIGGLARRRCEAAVLVEDFGHRARTLFPHPIAFRWRTVESSHRDLEGYTQVLECAEVTVCYLAIVAMVLARIADAEIQRVSEISKRISQREQGTNFGDWVAILREVRDAKVFRKVPDSAPFAEILHMLSDKEADQAVQDLSDRRNDLAHGRGPKGAAVLRSFDECRVQLKELLRAAEFLPEYRLRYIESTRRDTLARLTHYEYRDLMGDHPLVPLGRGTTEDAEVESGSLYLVDRTGALRLVRPLLTRRECPVCGSWATFYLDTWHKNGDFCELKGMEHGHCIKDSEIAPAFRQLGLLRGSA